MPDPTDPHPVADDPSGIVQQMPVVNEANDPPRIWLQEPVGLDYDRTWCAEPMGDEDVEYLRADISRATEADLRAEIERLRGLSKAAQDVMAERQRQINVEGWSPEHDDQYVHDDLPRAAACYALSAAGYRGDDLAQVRFWPWLDSWWKPTTPRRDLVKAGALILAEIERLDRAALSPETDGGQDG